MTDAKWQAYKELADSIDRGRFELGVGVAKRIESFIFNQLVETALAELRAREQFIERG